jgi:hypothetical protein
MRRIPMILIFLTALFVAAGCGQFGKKYEATSTNSGTATGRDKVISTEKFDEATQKKYGCTAPETFKSEGRTHITDVNEKVKYGHNPPDSGNHYQVPLDWGIYDTEQRDVEWVHNLEHGHIVQLYKGLSSSEKQDLLDYTAINPYHLLVIPRKTNPKDGVYYMAWTHEIYCKTPNKAALQYAVTEWRDQGPELFTTDASKSDNN